jgi:hypothetical protein
MKQLNLPECNLKLKKNGEKFQVFDPVRKKYVALTPEEWVRQHFIHFLSNEKQYPLSLMKSEYSLQYNKTGRRSDILIYDTSGTPLILVECKAPDIEINEKTFMQIARYNYSLKVKHLIVTNGMQHYCCMMNYNPDGFTFLKEIPDYSL